MAQAQSARAAAFAAQHPRDRVATGRRLAGVAALLMASLALGGCGGSATGGNNDGTLVTRSGVAVSGIADDGTANSPLVGGTCAAIDLAGKVLSSDTTGADGSFLLLVNPGVLGYIRCTDAGQSRLAIRTLLTTVGLAKGADLPGQDVLPATTVVARIVAQEASDNPDLDAAARFASLYSTLVPYGSSTVSTTPALQLLADAATITYDQLRAAGRDIDFEAVLADLYDDGSLNLVDAGDAATTIDAGVADLVAAAGIQVSDAVLQTHPAFTLSLLNVSGGASALDNVARFATRLGEVRSAANDAGGSLTVSAGNLTAPGPELQVSFESLDAFYDATALDALGLDAAALGPRDLVLGPNIATSLVNALSSGLVTLLTDVDFSNEGNVAVLASVGRIDRALLLDRDARRIALVSASDPDLARVASPRRLLPLAGDARIARIQANIDAARVAGARIVVLLAGIRSLDDVAATVAGLSGVDLVAGLPGLAGITVPSGGVGPFPVATTTVPDLDGADVPVVPAVGDYAGLFRLQAEFDPLGHVRAGSVINEADLVALDGAAAPTPADADVQANVVDPLDSALSDFDSSKAADVKVELDTSAAALESDVTNWGMLVAESALRVAASNASTFVSSTPSAALLDAAGMESSAPVPVGTLSRGDLYDLLPAQQLVGVLQAVTPTALKRLLEYSFAHQGSGDFAQIAGLTVVYDPAGTAQQLDADGNVVVAGTKVVNVKLTGGTTLIDAGVPKSDSSTINIAVSDRVVASYPIGSLSLVNVGFTVTQAVDNFVRLSLSGTVRADAFKAGGDGRISVVSSGT